MAPPAKGAEALSDLLQRFLQTSPAGRAVAVEEVEARWREVAVEVVGAPLAADTRVRGLRDGVLTIEVASSALLSELETFHSQELLRALRRRGAPFAEVREIACKLGAWTTS